jgi:hypothetical protein
MSMDIKVSTGKIPDIIQIALEDPLIKQRIKEVLNLDSYERRSVLNDWIEQLRLRNARREIIMGLIYLFDDVRAKELLRIINNQ